MVQSYKSGRAKVCLNISGLHTKLLHNIKQSFLRCFTDPIPVARIENWVPRIREDYHRGPSIKDNRVPRIREIGSLQIHTGYLTFSLKKLALRVTIFFFRTGLLFRARAGFRFENATLCVHLGRGQQGEIERMHPPPTNSKNRLKSFCEVGYTNFRLNVFAAGKRISVEILVGVGLHA